MYRQTGAGPNDYQRPWASPGPQPSPWGYAPPAPPGPPGPPAPPQGSWAPRPAPPGQPGQPGPPPRRKGGAGRVVAVVAIVLGALVLIGGTVIGAQAIGSFVSDVAEEDPYGMGGGGGYEPLTGHLPDRTAGAALPAEDLRKSVTKVLEDDYSVVDAMRCPATPKVDQGVVTVCHGTIDDEEWAVIVFFEDKAGAYTLLLT